MSFALQSTCLLWFSLCPQFAQSKTADGCQLPASDRHAHCKNILLHQRGAGAVSQFPDRDPENYIQPGDVWQPAGQHCSPSVCVCVCYLSIHLDMQRLHILLCGFIKGIHACIYIHMKTVLIHVGSHFLPWLQKSICAVHKQVLLFPPRVKPSADGGHWSEMSHLSYVVWAPLCWLHGYDFTVCACVCTHGYIYIHRCVYSC